MKTTRYTLANYTLLPILIIVVGLVACSPTEVDNLVEGQISETVRPTFLSPTAPVLTVSVSPTVAPVATLTTPPLAIDPSTTRTTHPISATAQVTPVPEPTLIVSIEPDTSNVSFYRENIWWSDDSRTLFYQNVETQQAWAYDLSTGALSAVPYVPRSFSELAPKIEAVLPEGATIYSISPRNNYVLFKIPLAEPIPLTPPRFENEFNPAYTFELWLRKDRQDLKLGLVDDCFGLLGPPIWAANEHRAVVNTYGTPDMLRACMHDAWLVDTEALSVNPLPVPWEGARGYSILDLSEDGQLLLVHADVNYLYNLDTKEQLTIPNADTDRAILLELGEAPVCLILELEFSSSILRDHVRRCMPATGSSTPLAVVEGVISQWFVSPDEKFIAFVIRNDFPAGNFYEHIIPGIWLLTLP